MVAACAWLALAGCKKGEAVGDGGAVAAAVGDGAPAVVVAQPPDAAKAAPPATADAATAVAAADAAAAAPAADAAALETADGAVAAADATSAAAPTTADAATATATATVSPDAETAAATGGGGGDAGGGGGGGGGAGGPWQEIANAALTAIREGKPEPLSAMFPPFRAARAACDTLYPDTAKKRAEWTSRTDQQTAELEQALRACRDLADWKQGTAAPATWAEPSPIEKCDDLAESDLRVLLDPGGEAGEAGTRYTITVHVVVLSGQPYPTRLLCGVRKP